MFYETKPNSRFEKLKTENRHSAASLGHCTTMQAQSSAALGASAAALGVRARWALGRVLAHSVLACERRTSNF